VEVASSSGGKPKKREQSSLFYDSNEAKMYMFGGWSNIWLNDMWCVSIGKITGPPYAIFSIHPKLGPQTGNTRCLIEGEGFNVDQEIFVRFESERGFEQVTA